MAAWKPKMAFLPQLFLAIFIWGFTHVIPAFLRPGQEADTSSRYAWTPQGVPGHTGLPGENLSQINQQKNGIRWNFKKM